MNALIVLVFYAVAVTLFLFGCLWKEKTLIPESMQLTMLIGLMAYGLVMAIWVAFRSNKVAANIDMETLKKAIEAFEKLGKAGKSPPGEGGG